MTTQDFEELKRRRLAAWMSEERAGAFLPFVPDGGGETAWDQPSAPSLFESAISAPRKFLTGAALGVPALALEIAKKFVPVQQERFIPRIPEPTSIPGALGFGLTTLGATHPVTPEEAASPLMAAAFAVPPAAILAGPAMAAARVAAASAARRRAAELLARARLPGAALRVAGKPQVAGAAKEHWQMTKAEFIAARRSVTERLGGKPLTAQEIRREQRFHKSRVASALSENKPVPPEVLADYPELAPAPAAEVARGQAEMHPTLGRPLTKQELALRERLRKTSLRTATQPTAPPPRTVMTARQRAEAAALERELGFRAAGQAEVPVISGGDAMEAISKAKGKTRIPLEGEIVRGPRARRASPEEMEALERGTRETGAALVEHESLQRYIYRVQEVISRGEKRPAPSLRPYRTSEGKWYVQLSTVGWSPETLAKYGLRATGKRSGFGTLYEVELRQPAPLAAAEPGPVTGGVLRPVPSRAEGPPPAQAAAPPPAPRLPPPAPPRPPSPPSPPPPGVPPRMPGAMPPPEEPFAANIRLSKYPEEARGVVKAWADAHATEVQAARRGVRSDAQVLEDAQSLIEEAGGNPAKVVKKWKPGQAYNAEEITALRGILREKAMDAAGAQRRVSQVNSAENQMAFYLALEEQAMVQKMVHGGSAEIGRALRTHRLNAQVFAGIGQADRGAKMEALLKRIGPGRERMDEIAAAMGRIDLDNPYQVNSFIRDVTEPKLWDYVMEVYYNAILSGPKTHLINEASNTAVALLSPLETAAAAATEQVMARLQGRAVERYFAEVPAEVRGMIEGLPEGVRAFFSTLKHGISPAAATKWEFRPRAFRGWFGRVVNAPSTALEAADALNHAVNYQMALRARVMRMARQSAKGAQAIAEREAELLTVTPPALVEEASRIAESRLFRGEPGAIVRTLIRLRDWTPVGLGGTQPLRFLFPFLRTPGNLLEFGLTRSPAAWLNPKMWQNVARKSPEASDQLGRAVLGTLGALAVALLFRQGKITGAAPTSPAERDRFYREGKQPYSVRIGNTWVQYQRLEPFNQMLSQSAAAITAVENKDKAANERIGEFVGTLGNNLVSQTYLTGFADFLNGVQQPERYGERLVTRPLTGIVPFSSLLRTAAQQIDPTFRQSETFLQSLQTGIPGLTQGLPPRLTAFGEEAQRPSPVWSPIVLSPARQSAVDAELERLGIEVGFVGDTIGGVELGSEQQQTYQRLAGQETYRRLWALASNPGYEGLPATSRERLVRTSIESAREFARREVSRSVSWQQPNAPFGTPEPTPDWDAMKQKTLQRWQTPEPTPVGAR